MVYAATFYGRIGGSIAITFVIAARGCGLHHRIRTGYRAGTGLERRTLNSLQEWDARRSLQKILHTAPQNRPIRDRHLDQGRAHSGNKVTGLQVGALLSGKGNNFLGRAVVPDSLCRAGVKHICTVYPRLIV